MALNKRQNNLIEYMLANPQLPEYTCAKNCGVPDSTYADWKRKGEFTEELEKRMRENFADGQRIAMETMLSLCREGDYKASEFILKNFGYNPSQKVEAQVDQITTIKIDVEE